MSISLPMGGRRVPPTRTLRESTLDALRQLILEGKLAPGTRLVERELCEMLHVSRTSVREALRHLEAEGLVSAVPKWGAVVAELSIDDVRDIYELRECLEGMAVWLFTQRASDDQLEDLVRVASEMEAAAEADRNNDVIDKGTDFFNLLLEGSGNVMIQQTILSLRQRTRFLRSLTIAHRGYAGVGELLSVVDAIRERNSEAARDAYQQHIRNAAFTALKVLQAQAAAKRENQD